MDRFGEAEPAGGRIQVAARRATRGGERERWRRTEYRRRA